MLGPMEATKFVDGLVLQHGSHKSPEAGLCALEAVAFLAGEPHSDAPKCASPVLARMVVRLNDRWDDERRQKLKPFLVRLIGTRADDASERRRAFMAADWAVRELLPMLFEQPLTKAWVERMGEWPAKLRALPEVADKKTEQAARDLAREARKAYAAYAANAAAYDAAYDAANAANAAANAANAAAYAAAASAAASAAYAAYDAAYDAANAAPSLRAKADASVLGLLDRMILVAPGPYEPKKRKVAKS